ncbi:TetR/AcrR family transcriptional regulator [Ferrimicrobium sp.]|uniref:TetR/AcrR family transcriptional regulator n=1 Tax=Ferrimicrobium sp. TaxID=2926050 RepID=UPI002610C2F6|nr:TetR family transcriptional regulator [Ferrimicrobium sp.]
MEINKPVGRREIKKAATRERIIEVARQLIAQQGFLETTILQITDKADVSERTFFRYFESKDDLLLLDLISYFDLVEAEVTRRPRSEEPLRALLEAIVSGIRQRMDAVLEVPIFRPYRSEVDLTGQLVRNYLNFELRVAQALTDRLVDEGVDAETARFRADVAAKLGVSTLRAAVREVFQELPERLHPETDELIARIERAFAIAVEEFHLFIQAEVVQGGE